MKIKYLYLFPDSFFFIGKNKVLFYNTGNHNFLETENNPFFIKLFEKLYTFDNLYGTVLDTEVFLKYQSFWKNLQRSGIGDIVDCQDIDRPISYPPILKLNHNIDSIRYDYEKKQAGYILNYLNEITVYLSGNKNIRNSYYKQTIYPISDRRTLDEYKLTEWLGKIKRSELRVINLLGEPSILAEYNELYKLLSNKNIFINYYLRIDDIEEYKKNRSDYTFPKNINLKIIYEGSRLERIDPAYDAVCLISDSSEFILMEKGLSSYANNKKSTEVVPIYTGKNIDFFHENVFVEKSEIINLKLTKKNIFIRMTLNSNFYGKLTIFPDGKIYSNVNYEVLGSLDDSLYELLYKESDSGMSRRKVRNEDPCAGCRFQWLCPPVSNYEIVMNKYDLCNIDPTDR